MTGDKCLLISFLFLFAVMDIAQSQNLTVENSTEERQFVIQLNCTTDEECVRILGNLNNSIHQQNISSALVQDFDECQLKDPVCPPLTTCQSNFYSYDCICIFGYITVDPDPELSPNPSNVTCQDMDECELAGMNNCSQNATCFNSPGSFSCECDPGFADLDPDMPGTNCEEITCPEVTRSMSDMDCGYTSYGSACILNCHEGYENNQTSTIVPSCQQIDEFQLEGIWDPPVGFCTDVDECGASELNKCSENATCSNLVGSYKCECLPGFNDLNPVSPGTNCQDIDECGDVDNCSSPPHGRCENIGGGFICHCNPGFVDTDQDSPQGTTCQDVNECGSAEYNNCSENATCSNFPGNFRCQCNPGFADTYPATPVLGTDCLEVTCPKVTRTIGVVNCSGDTYGNKCILECPVGSIPSTTESVCRQIDDFKAIGIWSPPIGVCQEQSTTATVLTTTTVTTTEEPTTTNIPATITPITEETTTTQVVTTRTTTQEPTTTTEEPTTTTQEPTTTTEEPTTTTQEPTTTTSTTETTTTEEPTTIITTTKTTTTPVPTTRTTTTIQTTTTQKPTTTSVPTTQTTTKEEITTTEALITNTTTEIPTTMTTSTEQTTLTTTKVPTTTITSTTTTEIPTTRTPTATTTTTTTELETTTAEETTTTENTTPIPIPVAKTGATPLNEATTRATTFPSTTEAQTTSFPTVAVLNQTKPTELPTTNIIDVTTQDVTFGPGTTKTTTAAIETVTDETTVVIEEANEETTTLETTTVINTTIQETTTTVLAPITELPIPTTTSEPTLAPELQVTTGFTNSSDGPPIPPVIVITDENADELAQNLSDSVRSNFEEGVVVDEAKVDSIINHLSNFADTNVTLSSDVTDNLIDIIKILSTQTKIPLESVDDSNSIPRSTDEILFRVELSGNRKYVSPASTVLRVGVAQVNLTEVGGLSFSLTGGFNNTDDSSSTIEIPSTLPVSRTTRIAFTAFQDATLFATEETTSVRSSGELDLSVAFGKPQIINSVVIGASVRGEDINNLTDPIVIRLTPHTASVDETALDNNTAIRGVISRPRCVFFDYNLANGSGDWSSEGCVTTVNEDGSITCECDHLTSFAILMDVDTVTHDYILEYLSYAGTAVSILGLIITIVTYLGFRTLRAFKSKKILVHFCVALLGLYITYTIGLAARMPSNQTQCIATGFFMQYFLTAAFAWMFVEVLDMYFLFVKVWSSIQHYVEKMALLGWGAPLILSVATLAAHLIYASNAEEGEDFTRIYPEYSPLITVCWMTTYGLYYTILIPLGTILAVNCIFFSLVVYNVTCKRSMKGSTSALRSSGRHIKAKQHLINALAILLLSGPTWIFGFLINIDPVADGSARRVLSYVFVIFNSLQGLWIFIVFIARPKKVRSLWASVFCSSVPGRRSTTSGFTTVTKARTASSSQPSSPSVAIRPATRGRYKFDVEGGGVTVKRTSRSGGENQSYTSESTP